MTDQITITGAQAQILYSALSTAIIVTRARLNLKSAELFRDAIALQLSAYEAEKWALAKAFPKLAE